MSGLSYLPTHVHPSDHRGVVSNVTLEGSDREMKVATLNYAAKADSWSEFAMNGEDVKGFVKHTKESVARQARELAVYLGAGDIDIETYMKNPTAHKSEPRDFASAEFGHPGHFPDIFKDDEAYDSANLGTLMLAMEEKYKLARPARPPELLNDWKFWHAAIEMSMLETKSHDQYAGIMEKMLEEGKDKSTRPARLAWMLTRMIKDNRVSMVFL